MNVEHGEDGAGGRAGVVCGGGRVVDGMVEDGRGLVWLVQSSDGRGRLGQDGGRVREAGGTVGYHCIPSRITCNHRTSG